MLRRICGTGWGAPTAAEAAVIEQLVAAHWQLLADNGRADVRSEAGYNACAAFLSSLEAAARGLGLEAAPRSYRSKFSANYRALFPDGARHYRVDVLEASVDQHAAIWVNGDKFELSPEAIIQAEELQRAWADLGTVLDRWPQAAEAPAVASRPTARGELAAVMDRLDAAWAGFEHRYISELIHIEEQARQLIVHAVDQECRLQLAESRRESPEVIMEAQRRLVASVARLNSVANFRRKGRDDLGVDILESATAVLRRRRRAGSSNGGSRARSAAEILAADVVASFAAVRGYLREVGTCLERVDPHLCNNAGLVARLVDWEESWEVGARYVRHAPLMEAVCDLVEEIHSVQRLAPALTTMCADCDVELFLVLPRIILLCFVADPEEKRAELIRSLLPHRFSEPENAAPGSPGELGPELESLAKQYRRTMQQLCDATPRGGVSAEAVAWSVLVKRAIVGAGSDEDACECLVPGLHDAAQKAVEDLMRDLERWSLELQRHCPEDWNQCSAVLVQCLTGGSQKQVCTKFQV